MHLMQKPMSISERASFERTYGAGQSTFLGLEVHNTYKLGIFGKLILYLTQNYQNNPKF